MRGMREKNKEMKWITFVVPAYNVQDYIAECLESLVNQTSSGYSIIIVNDGSTDEHTEEICKRYQEKYPKLIHYEYQENKGLGAARNTGMRYVTTPWVTFLDSDDWIMPNYVENFQREIERFSSDEIDLFFTLPIIYDNVMRTCQDWYDKPLFYEIFYSGNRIINPELERKIYRLEVNACRRIYRKAFLDDLEFQFPEGVKWEDVYPHFYLLSNAKACVGIGEIGFYYRVGTSGQITASSGKGRLDIVKVFAQTFEYLLKMNADEERIMIAIQLLINFSRWSISMSDMQTREELIQKLRILYRSIPSEYLKIYRAQNKADKYFLAAIRSKTFGWTLKDYLVKEIVVRAIKKMGRKRG